jgi:hypothetical protein
MITDPQSPVDRIDPDPLLVAAYGQTRLLVPQLIAALGPVADVFREHQSWGPATKQRTPSQPLL